MIYEEDLIYSDGAWELNIIIFGFYLMQKTLILLSALPRQNFLACKVGFKITSAATMHFSGP